VTDIGPTTNVSNFDTNSSTAGERRDQEAEPLGSALVFCFLWNYYMYLRTHLLAYNKFIYYYS